MATQDKITSEYPAKQRYNNREQEYIEEEQADELVNELLDIKTDAGYFETLQCMFKVGCSSFGGPMTQVEHLRECFVEELKWLNEEVFNEVLTVCCGIPGSVITQMAIAIGKLEEYFDLF